MLGLGRTKIAFPTQVASAFSFPKKFAICFSSSDGYIFFGDGPYIFSPNVDASKLLTFTPLLINPVSTASAFSQGESSSEYFIGVKSIKIDDKVVPIKTNLLSINNKGIGGTKISTVNPYTVLEDSIYKALIETYISVCAARNITTSDSVDSFEVCFNSEDFNGTEPTIEFVLQNDVVWKMFDRNTMVNINDDVKCLGFMNGGKNPRTSIVIGGYQLEDNLLQFDLATSRLGFSSLLYAHKTECVYFNLFG